MLRVEAVSCAATRAVAVNAQPVSIRPTPTAAEIGEALGVSPAAVSGAVKYLDGIGMVRRERERGSRRDVFVIDDLAWHDTLLQVDSIYGPMITALEHGIEDLGEDPARERLVVSREFMRFLVQELGGISDRWAARRKETGAHGALGR
jgi:DNA-binding transcriptional ArsR family regulator